MFVCALLMYCLFVTTFFVYCLIRYGLIIECAVCLLLKHCLLCRVWYWVHAFVVYCALHSILRSYFHCCFCVFVIVVFAIDVYYFFVASVVYCVMHVGHVFAAGGSCYCLDMRHSPQQGTQDIAASLHFTGLQK